MMDTVQPKWQTGTGGSPLKEGARFGSLRIPSLLFADDVVQCSMNSDLWLWFAVICETAGTIISIFTSKAIVLSQERVECMLWVVDKTIAQMFKYLRVLFTKGEQWNGR